MLSVVSATIVSSGSFDGMIRTPTTVGPAVVDGSFGGAISTSTTSSEPPNSVMLPRSTVTQSAVSPLGTIV